MSYNFEQHPRKAGLIWLLLAAGLVVLTWILAMATWAAAQKNTSLGPPASITPRPGNTVFQVGYAVGTQGYVCLPAGAGASWTVNGSRPEATLFADVQGQSAIMTHYLSPNTNPNEFAPKPPAFGNATWQSAIDGSKVWGNPVHAIQAGSDASCPNREAIPCLLLQSIGAEKGPAGGTILTRTSFIQRLNTKGGAAPATGCSAASDVGKQTLVPYTADYHFFRKDE